MSAKQAALLAHPEGTSKVFRAMRYGHRLLLPREGHQQSLITTKHMPLCQAATSGARVSPSNKNSSLDPPKSTRCQVCGS